MHDADGPIGALALRQVAAIEAFLAARRAVHGQEPDVPQGREAARADARRELLERQHAALVARAHDALVAGSDLVVPLRPRALVVHRDPWYADRLSRALGDEGVTVLARLDDGADAVGAAVADQPDLLLLEDPLPTMTGVQVVREVRRWSPGTAVFVQAADERDAPGLRDAGARACLARHLPPVDVARTVADALQAAGG